VKTTPEWKQVKGLKARKITAGHTPEQAAEEFFRRKSEWATNGSKYPLIFPALAR
jgi:hypothetical protein